MDDRCIRQDCIYKITPDMDTDEPADKYTDYIIAAKLEAENEALKKRLGRIAEHIDNGTRSPLKHPINLNEIYDIATEGD